MRRLLLLFSLAIVITASAALADDQTICAERQGERSITACTRSISSGQLDDNDLATMYALRGTTYRNSNDYDRAIADFTQTIQILQKFASADVVASAYVTRGNANLLKGGLESALADFRAALALDAKNEQASSGLKQIEVALSASRSPAPQKSIIPRISAPVTEGSIRGRSSELGIEFAAVGGASWCGTDVAIRLGAAKSTAFKGDPVDFQRMIGRIRAAVQTECPLVQVISFEGRINDRVVHVSEVSRLGRWRLVALDLATRRPLCQTSLANDPNCSKRVEAYLFAQMIMRGDSFAQVEMTTMLETDSSDHLVWTAGPVIGKLNLFDLNELDSNLTTSNQLADAIITNIEKACSAERNAPETDISTDRSDDIAYRQLRCRSDGSPLTQHFILVSPVDTAFQVFSIHAGDADVDAADRLAKSLLEAVKSAR